MESLCLVVTCSLWLQPLDKDRCAEIGKVFHQKGVGRLEDRCPFLQGETPSHQVTLFPLTTNALMHLAMLLLTTHTTVINLLATATQLKTYEQVLSLPQKARQERDIGPHCYLQTLSLCIQKEGKRWPRILPIEMIIQICETSTHARFYEGMAQGDFSQTTNGKVLFCLPDVSRSIICNAREVYDFCNHSKFYLGCLNASWENPLKWVIPWRIDPKEKIVQDKNSTASYNEGGQIWKVLLHKSDHLLKELHQYTQREEW